MSDNKQTSATISGLPPVRAVEPERVFRWLKLGARDIRSAPLQSLMHGVIVVLISAAILLATQMQWQLVMIAASCFLFTGPFLATGLYAVSHSLEDGQKPNFSKAIHAWQHGCKCLFRFGLLLLLTCAAWAAISLLLFYLFVNVQIADPKDFMRYVLTQHDGLFLLWLVSGGLISALAFSITVITMPLMVDKNVNTWVAIRTSVRAVGENPFTMVWWASAILLLTGLSFATGLLGFLVLYPLMGHASWHVYRDLVDTSSLPSYPVVE